jgi:cobalt-zinc-cadmium efflux system outer membrane protein
MDWNHAAARAALAIVACGGALHAQTIPPKLTLNAAVELALAQRQELMAADAALRMSKGAEVQAGLKPNPVFTFQSENWRAWQDPGFSPRTDLDLFGYITDTIETGGKRRLRTVHAESRTRSTELQRTVLEWSIRRNVAEAWWRAAGAAQRRGLLEQSRATLRELVRFQQTRLDLGAIGEIDVIKVRVEDERLAAAVAAAETEAEQARLALLGAMGLPQATADFEVAAQVAPHGDEPTPPPGDAAQRALEGRPDLAVERALVAGAQAAVDVERAQAKPNLNPYFGYKKSGAFSTLIGGVSVPLPIRDRNQGRIAEALAEVDRAQANLRASEALVQAEARAAAAELERRRALVESIRGGVRERAAETYRIARAAYQEQGVDLLFLLDAQRSLNEIELLYAQSLLDYRLSQERLAAATGYTLSAGGAE